MKLFGLTGGIGMGKSTAASLLSQRGIAVVDTDVIARQIVEPGQPALKEIQRAFGPEIISANGELMRHELARVVFSSVDARLELESILHPRIRAVWLARAEEWRKENRLIGVVVIPLLFETKAEVHFDATICVACSEATQEERLCLRGWSREQIGQRRQAQWPVEKKMDLSDFVVWSEGSLETHARQLELILCV